MLAVCIVGLKGLLICIADSLSAWGTNFEDEGYSSCYAMIKVPQGQQEGCGHQQA